MDSQWLSLLDVTIDFDQSHLFFPRLVTWLLVGLLGIIIISKRNVLLPNIKHARKALVSRESGFDRWRFFGTLFLIVAYFCLMDVVGGIFPNTGYGFLIVSMPFIFLLSLLYVDLISRRKLVVMALNAIIAPALAWYVLAQLFRITLP